MLSTEPEEHSPHVLQDLKKMHVCTRLQRNDNKESESRSADEEDHLLKDETFGETGTAYDQP